MKATQKLHELGQSVWLDNITRDLLTSGTLRRYIDDLSLTGLTSNPTIFDQAIKNSSDYDSAIRGKLKEGKVRRGAVLRAGDRRSGAGRRPVPPDLGPHQRRRRLGLARSLAASRSRHGQHHRGCQGAACASETPQPLHQDTRHQGGVARHRGVDLRRRARERDPAVQPRALRRRGRSISSRHRAAHCRRS